MPKKNWTDEERVAFAEKMKASRAAKKAAERLVNKKTTKPSEEFLPEAEESELKQQIKELQESQALLKAALLGKDTSNANVGAAGILGTFEKYILDPASYPDPCERIANEDFWLKKGLDFKNNYKLKWEVSSVSYTRIDNVRESQPKFNLTVTYLMRDPETYELNGKGFDAARLSYFEDPDAAFAIARENGVEIDHTNEKAFLDEMRYLRVRDWIKGAFFPNKVPEQARKNQEVVGNRLVEIYSVSSEDSERIPFENLKKF